MNIDLDYINSEIKRILVDITNDNYTLEKRGEVSPNSPQDKIVDIDNINIFVDFTGVFDKPQVTISCADANGFGIDYD